MPDEPMNILVVDDQPANLLVYRTLLEELDQNLITAASGEDALRAVLNHDFAVILLDVNMPVMNGLETARPHSSEEAIRQHPDHLPDCVPR